MSERKHRPVVVMGCPRSGTNLLYDTLLSAGGFAVYRGKLPVYQVLIPRFGRLDRIENRKRLMSAWVGTKGFQRTGLGAAELTSKILENCRCGGDFIRIVMEETARAQKVDRWAVYAPDTVLRVPMVKKEMPDALFVHMIRDGRDIALSLRKLGDFKPFPWSPESRSLEETALYWEWHVQNGRRSGLLIPEDYIEIQYEDLVMNPRGTLDKLGQFLDHQLDYDRIQGSAFGTVSKSNSSFRGEDAGVSPVERWRQRLSPAQVAAIEWHVGKTLEANGYRRSAVSEDWKPGIRDQWLRLTLPFFLDIKLWMKMNTPLGRLSRSRELDRADSTRAAVL